ncbi:MAG: protein phosphatase 2C domain-containing protein [Pseudomonadota bacterium]
MKLIAWAISDVGRKREHNEDSYLVDEGLHLFAVADGMGGHQGGAQASKMAIDILRREVIQAGDLSATWPVDDGEPTSRHSPVPTTASSPSPTRNGKGGEPSGGQQAPEPDAKGQADTEPLAKELPAPAAVLRSAARKAGRAIYDVAQSDARLAGMGTTLTAALFYRERAHFVHVGDSRAFLLRERRIEQITQDHSWIAEQVKAGIMSENEAKESRFRHVITRSVGYEREVEADLFALGVLPGDCFLFCSDGMSSYFELEEVGRILSANYYRRVPQLLVDLANERGGDDNITIVLVHAANDGE